MSTSIADSKAVVVHAYFFVSSTLQNDASYFQTIQTTDVYVSSWMKNNRYLVQICPTLVVIRNRWLILFREN